MWWWSLYLWSERHVISAEDFSRFRGSICFNSKLCSVDFSYFPLLWKQWDCRHLFFFVYALVDIVIRFHDTDLWSKLKRKEIVTGLMYVIREKLWKLLKWTVSFGWKKINLRLTVSKDFNGSMLVEKIITHRKGPLKLSEWTKNKTLRPGSGLAGINRLDYGT